MGNLYNKNVKGYIFGTGSIAQLANTLDQKRKRKTDIVIFMIDSFFKNNRLIEKIPIADNDKLYFIDTTNEPDTQGIDDLCETIKRDCIVEPVCAVGIGGGATLDTAKAISNLLTNSGKAEIYQGWDLVPKKGVYKIGIPTLSGTGAEASRTCVLSNKKKGIKLGMNSDYTMFDQLILDPDLTRSVPREQFFYTGMDTYMHCIESLNGHYRNMIVDSFAEKAVALCREIFFSDEMMSDENLGKMMVASYLGGCSAGNVGVIHPISAGLSIVLNVPHGLGNCLSMGALEEFYPEEYDEFQEMMSRQRVRLPQGLCKDFCDEKYVQLYKSSIVHETPLANALGSEYKKILTRDKVYEIYKKI